MNGRYVPHGRPRPAAGAAPDAGGGSPDEIRERDTERVGQNEEVVEVGCAVGVLPAADALRVAVGSFSELFLGEAGGFAGGAELRTDGPAAGVYPVGRGVAVHPSKLE